MTVEAQEGLAPAPSEHKGEEAQHDNVEEVEEKHKEEEKHDEHKKPEKQENPEERHEQKHEVRHEQKQEVQHEQKQEVQHEQKPEERHEQRHEQKHEVKHEQKPEERHEQKQEVRHVDVVDVKRDAQWEAVSHRVDSKTKELIADAVTHENQRWYPGVGWSNKMFPTDRHRWSSEDGKYQRRKENWPVPEVWGHPASDCEWRGDWEVVKGPDVDENGWKYGVSLGGKLTATQSATDCIRTRVWKRTARVKEQHAAERTKAKAQHASKCSALSRVKKHEKARVEGYTKETAAGSSLKSIITEHVLDLQANSKVLGTLTESITQISEQQQVLAKTLKKIHGTDLPPTAKTNPIVALHASLNTFTCNAATQLKEMNSSSITDTLKSLKVVEESVETTCGAVGAAMKKMLKKLEKADEEVKGWYGKFCKGFDHSKVHFGEEDDLWLVEKEYAAACEKFRLTFEEYKEAGLKHLETLQDLEKKVVDLVHSAGHSLTLLLKGFGGGSAWVGEDQPVRDITQIPPRVTIPALDPFASPLVLKHGPLQSKSLVGWKSNYAVATADRYLYLAPAPQDGKPYSVSVSLNLSNCELSPNPKAGLGSFLLDGVTSGFLGQSEKHITFKATSEEEMVDWMVVLKQRKEH
eukprot:TRINITY_DN9101_c0_g1_i1.p1 TRINITY_DN9101_c0_g1~~TRINITY_DN9101_c0_g1_i1.p1  ORF type:complete len:636 (+),score=218.48 TRINITY_DN9101_c0_g1_i1:479-2386(+)